MHDSHDSTLPPAPDTLSTPSTQPRRFVDASHPYRVDAGRVRLLKERRDTARAHAEAKDAADRLPVLQQELDELDELLRVRSDRAIDRITFRTRCRVRWARMTPTSSELGPDTVRHCGTCDRDVFDLSKMSEDEVEALLSGPTPCVRLHRRPDGRVVTAACPSQARALSGLGAAAGGALVASTLFSLAQLSTMETSRAPSPSHLPVRAAAPPPVPPVRESALRSEPETTHVTVGAIAAPTELVIDSGIRQRGRRLWEIRAGLLDRILRSAFGTGRRASDPSSAAGTADLRRIAHITPHREEGQPVGFALSRIRPGSLLARLGLRNGDVIEAVNGHPVVQPNTPLAPYRRLRRSTRIAVDLRRRGERRRHLYRIVD